MFKRRKKTIDEKIKSRNKLKKNLVIFFISLLVVLLICTSYYIIKSRYKELNIVDIKDYELYQYFGGIKFDYNGTLTLKRNGEITSINYNNLDIDSDNSPIYFKNIDNEVIFPESMELIIPRIRNKSYKINYFSKIVVEDDDSYGYLINGDKKSYLETSFIYDGNNMYFFLEETDVIIDKVTYKLSPLSYIIVNYRSEIDMYDKKTDKFTIIDSHADDVIASIDSYKVNLSTDMILYDDSSRLLIKNVDNLPTYEN